MNTWTFRLSRLLVSGVLFLLTATVALASDSGSILTRSSAHDQAYALLNANVHGTILGYAFGQAQDRAQLHVAFDLGNGQTEEAWVHYRPDLSEHRQTLTLFDQNGRSTQDVTQAKSLVTLKAGVTAWQSMEHVTGETTAMLRQLTAPAKTKRAVASALPTSAQALVPGTRWSADCEEFIDADGNFGAWGRAILGEINSTTAPKLLSKGAGDITRICPKYQQLNDTQRQNFWVWFAASVAMEESSCNPEISGQGPNATVAGLWQLDASGTEKYCDGVCGSINVYRGSENVVCGLKMLNWYTFTWLKNKSNRIYWNENYWETLHPDAPIQRRTNSLVQEYNDCH
jgi:hypothetical protein